MPGGHGYQRVRVQRQAINRRMRDRGPGAWQVRVQGQTTGWVEVRRGRTGLVVGEGQLQEANMGRGGGRSPLVAVWAVHMVQKGLKAEAVTSLLWASSWTVLTRPAEALA